jgi:hypothetical protein
MPVAFYQIVLCEDSILLEEPHENFDFQRRLRFPEFIVRIV